MREIRTFDIQYDEPATAWRVARPLVVEVEHGVLWLTIEGDAEDYWLDAGQSVLLPAGAKAWIGSGRGDVRLTVTSVGSAAALRLNAAIARPQLGSGRARVAPSWRQAVA